MSIDYFPLGLALGRAFCNRSEERGRLKDNIHYCTPTLLISPRRYGKTSLALTVILATKLPYVHIDFFSEMDESDIEKSILNSIGKLISQIVPAPQRALSVAQDFFSDMHIKVVLEKFGFNIEIGRSASKPAYNILQALKKLDTLAKKHKKKIILFFDEFQRLIEVTDDHSIEGSIRFVAQQSKNIVFIFSGSSRNLLKQMFDDSRRPLYKLCDRINLERISSSHYHKYIKNAFMKKYKQEIGGDVIKAILSTTENHPYYVNLLCSRLWKNKERGRALVVL